MSVPCRSIEEFGQRLRSIEGRVLKGHHYTVEDGVLKITLFFEGAVHVEFFSKDLGAAFEVLPVFH